MNELGENECRFGDIKDLGQPPKKSPLKAAVKKPWEDRISSCQERSLERDSKTSNEKTIGPDIKKLVQVMKDGREAPLQFPANKRQT